MNPKKICNALLLFFFAGNTNLLPAQTADTSQLRTHLHHIINDSVYRNHRNVDELNRVADYIYRVFTQYSDSAWIQSYTVDGKIYKNVVCSFGSGNRGRTVIGAHYDVCGNQDGADDNASGVAGLLELCRLLKQHPPEQRIDLVAYTLEEPPYFATKNMGSYVHAQYLHQQHIRVNGMISLEMIGFYSEEKKSQRYPLGLLRLFYGSRGNYITVVRKNGAGKFARQLTRRLKKNDRYVRTRSIAAPKAMTGIDFSDHRNYWQFGFAAVMITDTSFYRNGHYHQRTDTVEKLNIEKMAGVITQVYNGLF